MVETTTRDTPSVSHVTPLTPGDIIDRFWTRPVHGRWSDGKMIKLAEPARLRTVAYTCPADTAAFFDDGLRIDRYSLTSGVTFEVLLHREGDVGPAWWPAPSLGQVGNIGSVRYR